MNLVVGITLCRSYTILLLHSLQLPMLNFRWHVLLVGPDRVFLLFSLSNSLHTVIYVLETTAHGNYYASGCSSL